MVTVSKFKINAVVIHQFSIVRIDIIPNAVIILGETQKTDFSFKIEFIFIGEDIIVGRCFQLLVQRIHKRGLKEGTEGPGFRFFDIPVQNKGKSERKAGFG